MTTAIYYRVSTEEQTLEMQRHAVSSWLEATKHTDPIQEYSDIGISGKTRVRPGFQNLLKDCGKGKIKTVVVYKLDRLTRDAITAIQVVLQFDELGIKFVSTTQPMFSHGTPFRHAMVAIFAELAQMERETLIERVNAGLAAARKRGVKFGAPVKATEARAVEAIALRKQGRTYKQISKEMGLSTGSIHKLLKGFLIEK